MKNDQIFTPPYIVDYMLDSIEYYGENIVGKTIFEPSFGAGAFLTAIVQRNLEYAEQHNLSNHEIVQMLSNIYGVEIDSKYYNSTVDNLNKQIARYGLTYDWPHLICGNTLDYVAPVKFDYCAQNPPYIRVHDMDLGTRKNIEDNFQFGVGNTDLYVIFFEKCIKMMNRNGKMCFITPNSYFHNTSQKAFRQWLADMNVVQGIVDYGRVSIFDKIATYTAITIIDFNKDSNNTQYTLMKGKTEKEYTTIVDLGTFKQAPWTFTSDEDTKFLKRIKDRTKKLKDLCDIQYGLATNADAIYVVKPETASELEADVLRPVIKASTLNRENQIIFPYQWNEEKQRFDAIPEEIFKKEYPKTYHYLGEYREVLGERDMEKNIQWFQYARSQGIQNSNHAKFVLKHVVSTEDTTCSFAEVDSRTLVYSGMFIVVRKEEDVPVVREALASEEFCKYIKLVGKNMSGGYKSFNTAAVKNFGIKER